MPDDKKVYYSGTHRSRSPEETWSRISSHLELCGITRVADVTGLDRIGIPVAMAVRPRSQTLSVSQGKGLSRTLARLSAVMESIEFWYAESVGLPLLHEQTPSAAIDLPYDVQDLDAERGSLVTVATPMDWLAGTGLLSGSRVPVPAEAVRLSSASGPRWRPPGIRSSSNGLASGNTLAEARAHALYEIIERDSLAMSRSLDNAPGRPVDLTTVTSGNCAGLIRQCAEADVHLAVQWCPGRFEVPCFAAQVWSEDFPVTALGSGAHGDADIALSRAITEAAQSRLTAITGTRDDTAPIYGVVSHAIVRRPESAPGQISTGQISTDRISTDQISWDDARQTYVPVFDDFTDECTWLAKAIAGKVSAEPVSVDLATRPELSVVKVIAPGLAYAEGA
jgi:ribosomal protein S12 methylthiotransferase accessory factor